MFKRIALGLVIIASIFAVNSFISNDHYTASDDTYTTSNEVASASSISWWWE
jgi:hypothetical protein